MHISPPSNAEVAAEGHSARHRALDAPFLSVVIPTYRRPDLLDRVLRALAAQIARQAEAVEVVVCDDASGDATHAGLERCAAEDGLPLVWLGLRQNGGPARARNRAAARARGAVIALLGDDIVPAAMWLERHCRWHREHPEDSAALLGRVTWPTTDAVTPFMRFLEGGGRSLFMNYRDLPAGAVVSGERFYTCNVSYKRRLFERTGGFDETFPFASHEDLELGVRLERAGMRLVYDPEALGHHWHALDFAGAVRRVYRMGYSAVLYWRRIGERGGGLRRRLRRILARTGGARPCRAGVLALARRAPSRPTLWRPTLHGAYWVGFRDGLRQRTDPAFMEFGKDPVRQT